VSKSGSFLGKWFGGGSATDAGPSQFCRGGLFQFDHALIEYFRYDCGMVLFEFIDQFKQTLIVLMRLSLHSLLDSLVGELNVSKKPGVFLLSKGIVHLLLKISFVLIEFNNLAKGVEARPIIEEKT
jgi:hypothetical protein